MFQPGQAHGDHRLYASAKASSSALVRCGFISSCRQCSFREHVRFGSPARRFRFLGLRDLRFEVLGLGPEIQTA